MARGSTRRTDAAFEGDELAAFLLGVWTPCRSSNVAACRWVEESQTLEVEFRNGSFYAYPGVDADMAERFARTPSKGGDGIWDMFRYPGREFVRYF